MSAEHVLAVRDLTVVYHRGRHRTVAVTDISLHVDRGESVALIGESGAGKSTIAGAILGLVKPSSGTIEVLGRDVSSLRRREAARLRTGVQAVLQNPYASLDPRWRVGRIVAEPIWSARRFATTKKTRQEIRAEARALLEQVGLGADKELVRPMMLSGGERQRVAIARALAVDPLALVADEPVTALDNTTRRQIIDLLREIARRSTTGMLLISHSMSFVAELADRVYVITNGHIVEQGPTSQIMERPQHEYTQKLLDASRALDFEPQERAANAAAGAGSAGLGANTSEGAGHGNP